MSLTATDAVKERMTLATAYLSQSEQGRRILQIRMTWLEALLKKSPIEIVGQNLLVTLFHIIEHLPSAKLEYPPSPPVGNALDLARILIALDPVAATDESITQLSWMMDKFVSRFTHRTFFCTNDTKSALIRLGHKATSDTARKNIVLVIYHVTDANREGKNCYNTTEIKILLDTMKTQSKDPAPKGAISKAQKNLTMNLEDWLMEGLSVFTFSKNPMADSFDSIL